MAQQENKVQQVEHIVIIGNGISGVTAARYVRKLSDKKVTIISSETKHFFSRTALMYIYMGHMPAEDTKPYEDWFWAKNRLNLIQDHVQNVNTRTQTLSMYKGEPIHYDKLLIACGSKPNKYGWPGQDAEGVQGLYSMQDLEGMESYSPTTKHAVIVGGGLIGIEMAEMFASRGITTTFLVREKSYWSNVLPAEESEMISRHILEHHIDLRLGTELKEILTDSNGRARAVVTTSGEEIACQFVGLTAGVSPNIDFVKNSKECDIDCKKGILVNDFLATTAPNVFAVGDCAELMNPEPSRRPIEAIWYTGRMMGETAAYNMCDKRVKYSPKMWFNSAKFLDIEYQVYGEVPTKPTEHATAVYWEQPEGRKSVRIVFNKNTKAVLGFNLMGVRYRHEVCEKWIQDQTHVEEVLQQLGLANFDPEFFTEYESKIIEVYNKEQNRNLELKQKRSLSAVWRFLKGK